MRFGGSVALTLVLASSHRSLSQFWERDGLFCGLRPMVFRVVQRVGGQEQIRVTVFPASRQGKSKRTNAIEQPPPERGRWRA